MIPNLVPNIFQGYGYHGDFVNGWDVDVLQSAVTNCNDASGDMTLCPYFDYFTNTECANCKLPTYVQEDIYGPLDALPGCNPVQSGPGLANNGYATCGKPQTIALETDYFTDVTDTLEYAYLGCGIDAGDRTFTGSSNADGSMTVASCVEFCSKGGYTYAGLEYASQ